MNEKDRWGAISAAAIDLHCALKAEREAAIEVERLDKLSPEIGAQLDRLEHAIRAREQAKQAELSAHAGELDSDGNRETDMKGTAFEEATGRRVP